MRKVFILLLVLAFLTTGCTTYGISSNQEYNIISYYCSECGVESSQKTKYCPNCGEEAMWVTEKPEMLSEVESNTKNEDYTYKYEYLKKLDDLQEDLNLNRSETLYEEESNSEMLASEIYRFEKWNDMLDDIYRLLKTQLNEKEFEKLKDEQTYWLVQRENKAEDSSKEFEGMDYQEVQYNSYLAKYTEERCYELVNNYM